MRYRFTRLTCRRSPIAGYWRVGEVRGDCPGSGSGSDGWGAMGSVSETQRTVGGLGLQGTERARGREHSDVGRLCAEAGCGTRLSM